MRHVAILVALALTLLGCGGSDSDTDAPTTAPVATTGGGDTTTTSLSATTTSTSGSNGDISFANCPELVTWTRDFVMASQAAFTGGTDPTGFEYTAEYFQAFADRAPSEIADDMQVIAAAFGGFFDALAELDVDFSDPAALASLTPAQIQELEDAAEIMDSAAIQEAGDNINLFFERECS